MKKIIAIFVMVMTVSAYADSRNGMSTFGNLSEVTVASAVLGSLPEVHEVIENQQSRGFTFYGFLASGIQEFKDSRNFILVFKKYDYSKAPDKDGLYKPEIVSKLVKINDFSSSDRQVTIYNYNGNL